MRHSLLCCIISCCIAVSTISTFASPPPVDYQNTSSQSNSNQNTITNAPIKTVNVADQQLLRIVTPTLEKSSQSHDIYFLQLLQLILKKTEATDGPFTVDQCKERYTGKRFISELARDDGAINIIWTMNDRKRDQELLPIKISLLKGMNSYRVFLIRKADQEKFHKIHTIKDLSQYSAGLGANWPDTPIMQSNGLSVITSAHYELLFTMLAAKRFDYFPRGVYEPWDELAMHQEKDLVVEDSIMLHYPAPIYFFVNRKDVKLANRIERGLKIAIEDGSFDQLLFSIPAFKKGFEEMRNPSRRLLNLNADTPNNGHDQDPNLE